MLHPVVLADLRDDEVTAAAERLGDRDLDPGSQRVAMGHVDVLETASPDHQALAGHRDRPEGPGLAHQEYWPGARNRRYVIDPARPSASTSGCSAATAVRSSGGS